ncbi:MAG: TonB-dependent receptor [Bacteroidetes bacterium]|nr:TonB-dependent receptor [Bacteroidota bacterium]
MFNRAFSVLLFFVLSNIYSQNANEYKLNDVVVSGGRSPISMDNSARNVFVISSAQMLLLPVNTIQDLLQYVSGVDLKQRGAEGVQADVSLRGGSFEQTLILVNGIKMTDPQTGHHNLNIPFSVNDIERIEIVKGQASKTFGPNAFSGVVNIITKKNTPSELRLESFAGQHNYYSAGISGGYGFAGFNNRLSFNRSKSDGYKRNTEFEQSTFNYTGNYSFTAGAVNLLFGFIEKDFGANSFYTSRFPDQAEHTKTKFVNISADIGRDNFIVTPKLFWRRNDDEFVLNKFNPSFYRNRHQTNIYGAELQTTFKSNVGSTSLGIEFATDEITSNNLGEHNRQKQGLFFEHIWDLFGNLHLNAGGFVYKYSNLNWQIWPGFDAAYYFSPYIKTFFSVGKSFRIPSYTDLFYSDPVTLGNNKLKPEEAFTYELGLNYNSEFFSSSVSLFRREGKNIIDWVRDADKSQWRARNITTVITNGLEVGFNFLPKHLIDMLPIVSAGINYTYLDSDKKSDNLESRYVLDHLKHQAIINLTHELFYGISGTWFLRYEDRLNYKDHFLTDVQFQKTITNFNLSLKATNLFNKTYHDIAGVTLPGRWITAGVNYKLGF